jgi:hypothetical protein
MFNLTFETNDDSRIVVIEPKDSWILTDRVGATSTRIEGFYKNTGEKDYSKLIDYQKQGFFEFPRVEGIFRYIFDQDDEETIAWVEQDNQFKIYESRFPMSNGSDEKKVKTKTVPFFAKTIHVADHLARYPFTNTSPQFPLIYPQNYILDPTATDKDTDVTPRILYFAGQRTGFENEDGVIEIFENPGVPTLNPVAFMVNYLDDTGLDPNLGFDNQVLNGTNSVGLMQRFYLQNLARDDKGEIWKNYVKFNSIDNLNFSFRIKAFIDGQKFVVQELQGFNPLIDAPTNFRFYLDVYPDADDVANIINSPLVGVVTLLGT